VGLPFSILCHKSDNFEQSQIKGRGNRVAVWGPTFTGRQDVTGTFGNMMLANSVFHTANNFSENYLQFGHAPSETFASPGLGRKFKENQIERAHLCRAGCDPDWCAGGFCRYFEIVPVSLLSFLNERKTDTILDKFKREVCVSSCARNSLYFPVFLCAPVCVHVKWLSWLMACRAARYVSQRWHDSHFCTQF
jgi:hypothetical protein